MIFPSAESKTISCMHTQGQIKSIAGKAGRLKAKIPFFPHKFVFFPQKNSNLDFAKNYGIPALSPGILAVFSPKVRVFSPIVRVGYFLRM